MNEGVAVGSRLSITGALGMALTLTTVLEVALEGGGVAGREVSGMFLLSNSSLPRDRRCNPESVEIVVPCRRPHSKGLHPLELGGLSAAV